MATLVESRFTRYDLTPDELAQAVILSPLQRLYIQNELALVAEKKLALTFVDSQEFIQNEALLTGQLQILEYLLNASAAGLEELNAPKVQEF